MKFRWPLMKDTITWKDKIGLVKFILTSNRFTKGPKTLQFERDWSHWLDKGASKSLYVSSGSTANSLLIESVKEFYKLQDGDKVIVPACTWMTNVAPVIQARLEPIFCDINFHDFSYDVKKLAKLLNEDPNIKVVFVTHLIGYASTTVKFLQEHFPHIIVLEDTCESHGAYDTQPEHKAGAYSDGSTFSFYHSHHMTTIEGGMVCTKHEGLYELMRMKRSHGMAREASPLMFEKLTKLHNKLHPQYLFATDGFNFRNTELGAVIGLNQLKKLDKNIEIRRDNYKTFIRLTQRFKDIVHPIENQPGVSPFCFPIICKSAFIKDQLEKFLNDNKIETRPIIGGNLLRQPFLREFAKRYEKSPDEDLFLDFPNAELIHNNGFYIGNSHLVTQEDLDWLGELLYKFYTKKL